RVLRMGEVRRRDAHAAHGFGRRDDYIYPGMVRDVSILRQPDLTIFDNRLVGCDLHRSSRPSRQSIAVPHGGRRTPRFTGPAQRHWMNGEDSAAPAPVQPLVRRASDYKSFLNSLRVSPA